MAQYVTENPATKGMSDMQSVINQQAYGDLAQLRYQEARRTADAEAAVDEALRGWVGGQTQPGQEAQPAQGASLGRVPVTGAAGGQPPMAAPMAAPGASISRIPLPAPGQAAGEPASLQAVGQMAPIPSPEQMGITVAPHLQQQPSKRADIQRQRTSLANRLAQVKGGGKMAAELVTQNQEMDLEEEKRLREEHEKDINNFFTALEKNDTFSMNYWAQESGINIPPDLMQNAQFLTALKTAGAYRTFYTGDIEGYGKFLSEAIGGAMDGDPLSFQRAFKAIPPTRQPTASEIAASQPTTQQRQVDYLVSKGLSPKEAIDRVFPPRAGQRASLEQIAFDTLTAKGVDPLDALKQITAAKKAGGGTGNPSAFQQKFDIGMKIYGDQEQAALFASGKIAPSDLELRKVALDQFKAAFPSGVYRPRDFDAEAEIQKIQDRLKAMIATPTAQQDPGGEAIIPNGMRIPELNKEGGMQLEDGTAVYPALDGTGWWTEDGQNLYDADGQPVAQ